MAFPPTNVSVLNVRIICGKDVYCSSMAIQVIGPMAEYSGHCSITNPPLLPIYLPPRGPTIINATCLLYWLPSVRQIIFDIANSFKAIFNQYQHLPKHWHLYISCRNWVLSNDIFVRCLAEILNIFLCKSQSPGSPIMAVWRGFTVGISLQGKQKEVRSLEEIYICRSGSNLGFSLQRDKKNSFNLDSVLEKWKLVLIHNLFIQRSELP